MHRTIIVGIFSFLLVGYSLVESTGKVLFEDDFETGDLRKWDEVRGPMVVTNTDPRFGKYCVQAELKRGVSSVADAIKWFMPGEDTVYVRVYVKFSEDYNYPHHFITLLGNEKTNRWSAFGKAGKKPDGSYFSSGMETWFAWGQNPPPGELHLYTYYLDMQPDRRMGKYWGNSFFPPGPGKGKAASEQKVLPELNLWQCWEFMIQLNQPEEANGKQAMWLDGKPVGEFTGIRWRNKADLKVNAFWLQHYGYDPGDPTKQHWGEKQTVWFDDVVISTEYIGPRTK